jgi:hypothetical protein
MLSSCNRCGLKFFAPTGMLTDPQTDSDYLWTKFNDHRCSALGSQQRKSDTNLRSFQSLNPDGARIAWSASGGLSCGNDEGRQDLPSTPALADIR